MDRNISNLPPETGGPRLRPLLSFAVFLMAFMSCGGVGTIWAAWDLATPDTPPAADRGGQPPAAPDKPKVLADLQTRLDAAERHTQELERALAAAEVRTAGALE